jgi:hypothetical protein
MLVAAISHALVEDMQKSVTLSKRQRLNRSNAGQNAQSSLATQAVVREAKGAVEESGRVFLKGAVGKKNEKPWSCLKK